MSLRSLAGRWPSGLPRVSHFVSAALLCAVLCAAFARPAYAQTPPAQDPNLDSAARVLFEDGRRAFSEGDYPTALSRFQQAYDISHRAPLLVNIGTTLDRMRREEDALAIFEQYLREMQDPPNRAEIEARVRALREAVDARHREAEERAAEARRLEAERAALEAERQRVAEERERAARGGPPAEPTPGASGGGGGMSPVIFGVGAGLTAVAAGVLVWSGVDTLAANDNYVRYSTVDPNRNAAQSRALFTQASDAQLRTNILVGVTGALAVTTLVLVFFTDWDGETAPAAAATVQLTPLLELDGQHAVLGVNGRF